MSSFGWAYIHIPNELQQKLNAFVAAIPPEWTTDNKGNPNPNVTYQHHSSFLLRLPRKQKDKMTKGLQQILSQMPPIKVSLGKVVLEKVQRITSADIYAFAVPIISPELRALRERCMKEVGGAVPYESAGHISIAYIDGKYKVEAAKLLERLGEIEGFPFVVEEVVLDWKESQPIVLQFADKQ